MNLKQLIVNADDFGLSKGVNKSIVLCHEKGILSSASLMANMTGAEDACNLAKKFPTLGVGVHLTLTHGKPLSSLEKIPDLIDKDGFFLPPGILNRKLWRGIDIFAQVRTEYTAQIRRALDLGIQPSHLDSHHGIHKRPVSRKAILTVADEFSIRRIRNQYGPFFNSECATFSEKCTRIARNARRILPTLYDSWTKFLSKQKSIRMPDRKISIHRLITGLTDSKKRLLICLAVLPDGISEVIFHPGFADPDSGDSKTIEQQRINDHMLLIDKNVIDAITKHRIRLITYRDV